jgi:hypothetical protein
MPIINRKKIKLLLSLSYENSLIKLNSNLVDNINSLGTFSLTFDIWTANNQDCFLGLILIYINSKFELIYQLIGKLFILFPYLLLI